MVLKGNDLAHTPGIPYPTAWQGEGLMWVEMMLACHRDPSLLSVCPHRIPPITVEERRVSACVAFTGPFSL